MENRMEVLREVFGKSSSVSEDFDPIPQPKRNQIRDTIPSWEQINEINGLWLCRGILSPQHQSSMLSSKDGSTKDSHNQTMKFGDIPAWATELSSSIREVVLLGLHESESIDLDISNGGREPCLLSSNLLWREPLFDQLIVNVYHPGERTCAHVVLMKFEDGIAILSLKSSCVMHFTRVEGCSSDIVEKRSPTSKVPVLLTPGSLVLMSGEAR